MSDVAQKAGRGRPSIYTQELADEICRRLADGETLRAICRSEGMPTESTVRNWALDEESPFFAQYAKAREIGYLGMFDEIKEIADTTQEGVTVTRKLSKDGDMYDETKRADMIEHRKLRVDARKWMLAKALPKVFGERVTADINAKVDAPSDSLMEAARRIAFVFAQAGAIPEAEASPPTKH